jgi:hypothetical protein
MMCVSPCFQSCGKIFKLARPVDPVSQLPAAFALVTYSQGLCAARCFRTLNGYVVDAAEGSKLVVKVRGLCLCMCGSGMPLFTRTTLAFSAVSVLEYFLCYVSINYLSCHVVQAGARETAAIESILKVLHKHSELVFVYQLLCRITPIAQVFYSCLSI